MCARQPATALADVGSRGLSPVPRAPGMVSVWTLSRWAPEPPGTAETPKGQRRLQAPCPLLSSVLGGLGAHASLHTRTCIVPVGIFSFSPCPKDLKTESVGARSRSETWGAFFQRRVFVTAHFLGSVLPETRKLNLRARIFDTARAKVSPRE